MVDSTTLDDMIELVRVNTGRTDKDDVAEQGILWATTNISQKHPFDELRFEFDTPVATGAWFVQLPADVDQILEARLIDAASEMSYSMILKRKSWFVKLFPDVVNGSTTGRPIYCMREQLRLVFDRISDGAYTTRITAFRTGSFSTGASRIQIPGSSECLIAYATAKVFASVQMYQDAQFWMSDFRRLLKDLSEFKNQDPGGDLRAEPWCRENRILGSYNALDPFQGLER